MPASKPKKTKAITTQKKQPVIKRVKASPSISPEQRYRMVQESAYYLAEKADFNGDNMEHWLAAEREINDRLG